MPMLVLLIVMAALVIIFSIQNALPVTVTFLFWRFSASLAMIIILSVLTGMIITSLLFFLTGAKKLFQKKTISS